MSTRRVVPYKYEIELPDDIAEAVTARRSIPILVFLHGSGECGGNRAQKVRIHGPWKQGQFNQRVRNRLGQYLVIAPHIGHEKGDWDAQRLAVTLCVAFGEIRSKCGKDLIDPARVYVTGLSLGGRGALELALRGFPDPQREPCDPSEAAGLHFRAAAIICPEVGAKGGASRGLNPRTRYQFFHRVNDWNRATRGTYRNFRGAPNAEFHLYPGCNHDCWTATYANSALYDWFDSPALQPHWGTACDRSMCAEPGNNRRRVKRRVDATFCDAHAEEFDWVASYSKNLQQVP